MFLKVLPDVRSPVAVVMYTDTHTYKQKVLLYSKFMFNSKANANGDRYLREYLQGTPRRAVAGRSCHKPLVHEALGGYSYTVQLFLLNINVLCRRTSMYNRSTTEVQVPSASCTRGLKRPARLLPPHSTAIIYMHNEFWPRLDSIQQISWGSSTLL